MRALLMALTLAAGPDLPARDGASPNELDVLAATDLTRNVPPPKWPYTRYLALSAVPPADRTTFARSLLFWLNSTCCRRRFVPLRLVADGLLARIDLQEFEWDSVSRGAKLRELEKLGIDFAFRDMTARSRFIDIWESLAAKDIYFAVSQIKLDGSLDRGWLDPAVEEGLRTRSRSAKAVLRADWWLVQASLDRPNGFYSDLLMLPPKEADLYKRIGVDLSFVARERQATGDAAPKSIVALNNRGLELLPSQFGRGVRFVWRTYDVKSNRGNKSIYQNFMGTIKHDGREVIFSLPNGLHGYYVADGAGKQIGEVPTDVAQDKIDSYDGRVINAYKCVNCHGATGINGQAGEIKRLMAADRQGVGLAAISRNKDRVAELTRDLDDYYTSYLGRETKAHQDGYRAAVKELTNLEAVENGQGFLKAWNAYRWKPVDMPQAAREFGVPIAEIPRLLSASNNGELIVMKAGGGLARDAFEVAFKDAMRNQSYPWERPGYEKTLYRVRAPDEPAHREARTP